MPRPGGHIDVFARVPGSSRLRRSRSERPGCAEVIARSPTTQEAGLRLLLRRSRSRATTDRKLQKARVLGNGKGGQTGLEARFTVSKKHRLPPQEQFPGFRRRVLRGLIEIYRTPTASWPARKGRK